MIILKEIHLYSVVLLLLYSFENNNHTFNILKFNIDTCM